MLPPVLRSVACTGTVLITARVWEEIPECRILQNRFFFINQELQKRIL